MAIAFDASADGFTNSGTSLTFSHTCSSSNRVLLVSVWIWNGTVSSPTVTYGGVSLTNLGSRGGDFGTIYIWGLANPASGANNIVITNGATVQIFGTSASYTGVDQSTPFPDSAVNGTASSTTITSTPTVSVDGSWLYMCSRTPSAAPTAGTGTYIRKLNSTSGDSASAIDSNGPVGTGSQSLIINRSPSGGLYVVTIPFAPVSSTAIKTVNGLAKASVKTVNGLAIASVKTVNGLA